MNAKKVGFNKVGLAGVTMVLGVLFTSGCVTTETRSYSNPSQAGHVAKNVAVYVATHDVGLERATLDAFGEQFAEKGVQAVDFKSVLPPVKSYTEKEMLTALRSHGIDSVMEVTLDAGDIKSTYIGTYNSGSAYTTMNMNTTGTYGLNGNMVNYAGNSTGNATTRYSGYSTAMYRPERNTSSQLKLLSVKGGKTDVVWVSQAQTEAGGKLFISDSSTASSLATDTVNDLIKSGHIYVPKKAK